MRFRHFLMNQAGDAGGGEPGATMGTGGSPGDAGGAAGGEGAFSWPDNWKEQLPEDIRAEGSLKQIQDIPSLAKSYVHAQKMVGANKAIVPDPKLATDQDWREFFMKAGLPESPDQYTMELEKGKTENLPEGFMDSYKKAAHELNILPHQAKAMFEWYQNFESDFLAQQDEASKLEQQQNLDAYQKTVGAAYDKKLAFANKIVDEHGGEELSKVLVESGLNNHPQIIDLFSKLGEQLYQEDQVLGEGSKGRGGITPDQATEKIAEIKGDKGHPYWNAQHPNHQRAIDEMTKLYEMKMGSV